MLDQYYNPDYEYFLKVTNEMDKLEQIKNILIECEKEKSDHQEYYKIIKRLCNKELDRLMDIINSFE